MSRAGEYGCLCVSKESILTLSPLHVFVLFSPFMDGKMPIHVGEGGLLQEIYRFKCNLFWKHLNRHIPK